MGFLLQSAAKDLRRRLADRASLLIWIGIPVMIGALMALASGGGDVTPKAHVLLVDQDESLLSHFLSGSEPAELGEVFEFENVDLEEGRKRIAAGDASALVILPEGFTEAVLKEEPTQITLITNPAQRILPSMVEDALGMLVEAGFYAQRLIGEPLRDFVDALPEGQDFYPDATVASFSAEINRRMRRLDGTLFPPVLKLETEVEAADQGFNFGLFFLPGVLFMSMLFIAQGMSGDVWEEKEKGTLRRIVSAPPGLTPFLGGKLLAGAVIMTAVIVAGLVLGVSVFDLSLTLLPVAVVWGVLGGAVLCSFFFLIQTFASSQRTGNILSTMVLFPLMMIGGCFFPFEAMPPWMAGVGRWTPNGLAVVRLKELLGGELHPGALLASGAAMALPAALAFLLTLRRLRAGFAVR